ncbi:MAG: hydrogenase small subunit [Aquificae bacterium]|nr:hydrogenase small subunit [Aquificota bacterium]
METVYESLRKKGVSRRDFLKLCTVLTASLGMSPEKILDVAYALETKPKPVVIWLEFQDCAGCSESFIRSTSIFPSEILLDLISLEYHETLMAPSGEYAELSKEEAIEKYKGKYILVVEGSVSPQDDGVYCTVGGKSNYHLLLEAAEHASAIIAVGSCACWSGIPGADPNPTGAIPVHRALKGKTVINVPGCPPIADVMVGVIANYLILGKIPELDELGRPKVFYGQTIHDRCYRRPFYNAGKFAKSFDDETAKEGMCLFKLGCKGPVTRNACSTVRWNGGISFPIQSGHPCFGCSEPDFWDRGHIYTPLSVVSTGISGKEIAIATATGVAVGVAVKWLGNLKKGEKNG